MQFLGTERIQNAIINITKYAINYNREYGR